MTHLADKRVGIIGTGATAVQCIAPLARDSQELFVFQRTPSSIDVRNNHAIDPDWFATLEPGWQRKWLLNFATLQTGVGAAWTDFMAAVNALPAPISDDDPFAGMTPPSVAMNGVPKETADRLLGIVLESIAAGHSAERMADRLAGAMAMTKQAARRRPAPASACTLGSHRLGRAS